MNIKDIIHIAKYSTPVIVYSPSMHSHVQDLLKTTTSVVEPVELAFPSFETQQIDEKTKEDTIQSLSRQIQELQENRQDTGIPITFIVDRERLTPHDIETQTVLVAAAQTALSDDRAEVSVALLPLNEKEPETPTVDEAVEDVPIDDVNQYVETLESLGCFVIKDNKTLVNHLNSF